MQKKTKKNKNAKRLLGIIPLIGDLYHKLGCQFFFPCYRQQDCFSLTKIQIKAIIYTQQIPVHHTIFVFHLPPL